MLGVCCALCSNVSPFASSKCEPPATKGSDMTHKSITSQSPAVVQWSETTAHSALRPRSACVVVRFRVGAAAATAAASGTAAASRQLASYFPDSGWMSRAAAQRRLDGISHPMSRLLRSERCRATSQSPKYPLLQAEVHSYPSGKQEPITPSSRWRESVLLVRWNSIWYFQPISQPAALLFARSGHSAFKNPQRCVFCSVCTFKWPSTNETSLLLCFPPLVPTTSSASPSAKWHQADPPYAASNTDTQRPEGAAALFSRYFRRMGVVFSWVARFEAIIHDVQ